MQSRTRIRSRPKRSRKAFSFRHGKRVRRGGCGSKLELNLVVSKDFPWKLLGKLLIDLTQWVSEGEYSEVLGIVRNRDLPSLFALTEKWGLQSIHSTDIAYSPELACKRLLCSVIAKYQFPSKDRVQILRDAAINKMLAAEERCSTFNRIGWKLWQSPDKSTQDTLRYMREFIEYTIGYFPDWEAVTKRSRHGPGSDTMTSAGSCSAYDKYVEWPYAVTRSAVGFARRLICEDERWYGALEDSYRRRNSIEKWSLLDLNEFWSAVLVNNQDNRITTVRKNGLTDRSIAIENRLNLMLQLGVDGFIRKRLKRWKIDLDSQLRNQEMARLGSLDKTPNSYSTIDLSDASDNVSLRIVKLLFPKPWYTYLCDLRSPSGLLPNGKRVRFSKLSSMGNGYTFAVETLIFSAIAYAAMQLCNKGRLTRSQFSESVSVYGDDIIVPAYCYNAVVELLRCCGFSPNPKKSFTLPGSVRESCGTDWVCGVDTRPVYVKEHPSDVMALFGIANRLNRWGYLFLGSRLEHVSKFVLSLVPERLKVFGPPSNTDFDSWIHSESPGEFDRTLWTFRHYGYSRQPRCKRPKEFLLGRLSNSLQQALPLEPWEGKPFNGSRFLATLRGKYVYRLCTHYADWRTEYCR